MLKENGAKAVLALVTHGILSGAAIETLNGSVLEALVVTNTVPLGDKVQRVSLPLYRGCGVPLMLTPFSALSCVLLTSALQSLRYVALENVLLMFEADVRSGHPPHPQR